MSITNRKGIRIVSKPFSCASCGRIIQPNETVGQPVRCPHCKEVNTLPDPAPRGAGAEDGPRTLSKRQLPTIPVLCVLGLGLAVPHGNGTSLILTIER